MLSKESDSWIYIDLDSLLDTRIGTVAKIDESLIFKVLKEVDYYKRITHHPKEVDRDVFNEEYEKRDVYTLALSPSTRWYKELGKIAIDKITAGTTSPLVNEVKIIVNTYPYKLSEEDMFTIGNCLTAKIGDFVPVEVKYIPLEELTPQLINKKYSLLIMYEYAKWLDIQTENFKLNTCSDTSLLVPMIYFNEILPKEELKASGLDNEYQAFEAMEVVLRMVIDIDTVDVALWCAQTPTVSKD